MKALNLLIVVVTNTAILTIAGFMMHASLESKTANYKIAQSLIKNIPPVTAMLASIGVVNYPDTVVSNFERSPQNESSTLMIAANTHASSHN